MVSIARHIPSWLGHQRYWLAVVLPLLIPMGWCLREMPGFGVSFAWFSVVVLYVAVPLLDLLIGRDGSQPEVSEQASRMDRWVPIFAALSYLWVLAWALHTWAVQAAAFNLLATIGWALSLANIGGVVAINVAHELIHRRDQRMRGLGGLLLACVWYPGFKLEHPFWHHLHVATPADPSSAPLNSTVYQRVPRALWLNTLQAWSLGEKAARSKGRVAPWLLQEMTLWFGLSLGLTVGVLAWLGWPAMVLFVLHGIGAAALLEVINYVEHYGLERNPLGDGRFERPQVSHSWESDYWLSNAILLQLPRHADHHVNPMRPFTSLQKTGSAPQLPIGYSTLVMVALVPALWRAMVHPRIPARDG